MKSPDQIYSEFEARQLAGENERKEKITGRIADVVLLLVALAATTFWAITRHDQVAGIVGTAWFTYASVQLGKRWRLEDRIDRSEKSK